MKKTLKDLWYGNISPNEERYIDESVRKKLINQFFAYDEKLKTILSQEERDIVEKKRIFCLKSRHTMKAKRLSVDSVLAQK